VVEVVAPAYQEKFSLCIQDYNLETESPLGEADIMPLLANLPTYSVVPHSTHFTNHPNGKAFLDFNTQLECDEALVALNAAIRTSPSHRLWKAHGVLKETLKKPVRRKRRSAHAVLRCMGMVCLLRTENSYWHFVELKQGGMTRSVLEQHMAENKSHYKERGTVEHRHEVFVPHLGRFPAMQVTTAYVYDVLLTGYEHKEHSRLRHASLEIQELSRAAERQLKFGPWSASLEKLFLSTTNYVEVKWVPVAEVDDWLKAENQALHAKVELAFPSAKK
jgi:hypothetical protein